MPKIQIITDGHPDNTTLIIDGVDVTNEVEVGWIMFEIFGRDPEQIRLPFFKMDYCVIEEDPLNPKVIRKSVRTIGLRPDDAGAMQGGIENKKEK